MGFAKNVRKGAKKTIDIKKFFIWKEVFVYLRDASGID